MRPLSQILVFLCVIAGAYSCGKPSEPAIVHISAVGIEPNTLSLKVGERGVIRAVIVPEDATDHSLTWESEDPEVVQVMTPDCGDVLGVQPGRAFVHFTTTDGNRTAKCYVTVSAIPVSSVTLSSTYQIMEIGGEVSLTATVLPETATDRTVQWSTSNPSVATVENGVVTAVGGGSATITATAGGIQAQCDIRVLVHAQSVSWDEHELKLNSGESTVIHYTIVPEDANDFSGITLATRPGGIIDIGYASAPHAYTLTALKGGMATTELTLNMLDGTSLGDSFTVTVSVPATGVYIYSPPETMEVGETKKLLVFVTPSDATDKSYTITSSNPSVASVTEDGHVTAHKPGTVKICVQASAGPAEYYTLVVWPEAVDLGLTHKWASCNLGASSPEEYGDYYAWGETKPKTNYVDRTYKYADFSGSFATFYTDLTKYTWFGVECASGYTPDYRETLTDLDDAAKVNLKGNWHIPTMSDAYELHIQCAWSQAYYNGIPGYKVTGPNGNWIFLPYTGFMSGTSLASAGSCGYFWFSQIEHKSLSAYAYYLLIDRSNALHESETKLRYLGLAIRPVK